MRRPSAVFAKLYEQNTLARIRLQGLVLGKVKSHLEGRLLTTAITQDDLKAVGAEATDTEDVINRLMGVKGVEAALLFLQLGTARNQSKFRAAARRWTSTKSPASSAAAGTRPPPACDTLAP